MGEVREEAAAFQRDQAFAGLARFRRFAEGAPLFEVIEVKGDRVDIEFVESGEKANVRLSDVQDSILAT
jgi:hypothetical protein